MIYIYTNELVRFHKNYPYTFELLEEKGLKVSDVCKEFKEDWWATDKEFLNPVVDNGVLREKTKYELYIVGEYTLLEGEKVENLDIIIIGKPTNMLKPIWDYSIFIWSESATEQEIYEHEFNKSVDFYNTELEFASKATAELSCEIITVEQFEDVKMYMKAIDPYKQKSRSIAVMQSPISRPELFKKYDR